METGMPFAAGYVSNSAFAEDMTFLHLQQAVTGHKYNRSSFAMTATCGSDALYESDRHQRTAAADTCDLANLIHHVSCSFGKGCCGKQLAKAPHSSSR